MIWNSCRNQKSCCHTILLLASQLQTGPAANSSYQIELSPVFLSSVNCILVKSGETCTPFLLSCVPVFQLKSLLLGKKSGPQIIALVRLQRWNCENYCMIDSHENESHSTKAKSPHFSWQSIDFSCALLKRYQISQRCRSWSWSVLKTVSLRIFSWVTGTAFLQSCREGQRCHSLHASFAGSVAFLGETLLVQSMKYIENNLLACCNSDVFRFEILSDQSSLLLNSLIKNKSAVFIKCLNVLLWLEEHTREGFVEM